MNGSDRIQDVFCARFTADHDDRGKIIKYDDCFLSMTGYKGEQLDSGDVTFFSLIPPEDRTEYLEQVNRIRKSGGGTLEHRIVCADGRRLEVICIGEDFTNDDGHACVNVTLSDISRHTVLRQKYASTRAELDALLGSVPGGLAVFRVENDELYIEKATEEYYHLTGSRHMPDRKIDRAIISDRAYDKLVRNSRDCTSVHKPFIQDIRVQDKEQWLRLSGRYFDVEGIDSELVYCAVMDITDKVKGEKLLTKQNLCFKMISENTEEVFFDYDAETDLLSTTSQKLKDKKGSAEIQSFLAGKFIEGIVHEDDLDMFYSTWNRALLSPDKGSIDFRTNIFDKDYRWYKLVYVSIAGEDNRVSNVYGMIYSIDHFKLMKSRLAHDQQEIERLTVSDHVTGLYNRNAFKKAAKQILKEQFNDSQCFALVYSDINDFSYVNENFGYEAGDEMLRSFADIVCGNPMSLAGCRIYSDYFVAVMRGSDREQLIREISASNTKFSSRQKEKYPHSDLQVSSGVYFFHSDSDDITIAIDNANLARRSVKGSSEIPCGVYTERMRKKRSHDQTIASEIWTAITSGAIELFLQPKFDLVTREMIGAEALTRWRNPDGTYKLPYEFIDVLENVGYITQLDMYIYEQVLKNLAKWKKQGKKLVPISVNFSRKHNNSPGFVTRVSELADIYGVDKKLIELEITESCFTQDVKNLFSNMRRLREQGFRIDIDDFGTGYSSLSILIDAPVDIVKVDKVFIDDISNSERSRDYVQHISNLIQSTRKDIIFEGVETEDQAKILAESGHTMAQGWLFDKAIPVDEFDLKYLTKK